MKKIIFLMMVSFIMLTSFAQTESPHLTFKGVPIDGTYSSFVTKLKQKGFKQDLKDPYLLLGDFAGYSDCKIVVTYNKDKNIVYGVGVIFEDTDSWQILYSNYTNLKRMLTIKYGEPNREVEEFLHPEYAENDRSKIHEVKMGRSTFESIFENEKGKIILKINELDLLCYVSLIYVDYMNLMKADDNAIDDL